MPVTNLPENQVFSPPLIEPVIDSTGRMSLAWARWFQALYMRTAYDGNAIDETAEVVNDNADLVEANTQAIAVNAQGIATNASNIQANADLLALVQADVSQNALNIEANITAISANESAIQANADAITTNESDIDDLNAATDQLAVDILETKGEVVNSRKRIFGDTEPSVYDDTGTSYSTGDLVVSGNLGSGSDYYYRAKTSISAPAGTFNPALWDKIALNSVLPLVDFLSIGPVRAMAVVFQGRSTAGAVTPTFSFNLDSLEQVSTGVYEGSVSQSTFWGSNIFTKTIPLFDLVVAPSPGTEFFTAEYEDLGSGDFRISVYEVTKGAGSDLIKTLYDPDDSNDLVSLILLTDIGSGALPPA